uniref:Uncharacterized protein n=1 Tax=Pipistrellus kuhlii TaxID=59472 RepID=A0A7J7SED7_PIPKU|nr:hypothetical protein mPipKuh1_010003 [Pipistrellus kuhlii]
MDLSSQPPAPPNGLPLPPGCREVCALSHGVVWAFLPVFVFSEKLGGCQQPHWAVWSQKSELLADPLPFRKPGLRLSPHLLRACASPFRLRRGGVPPGGAFSSCSVWPCSALVGRGCCSLTDSSPSLPALRISPALQPPPGSLEPPEELSPVTRGGAEHLSLSE